MKFMIKKSQNIVPQKKRTAFDGNKNNTDKEEKPMDKLSMVEAIINDEPKNVKRLKKDKGLIERTESSKTILTEDNKQLLVD